MGAIVGKKNPDIFPIVVVTGAEAPFIVTAVLHGHTIDNFESHPVLNYGNKFELSPDHLGECQIGDSRLFSTKGSFVLANNDRYLVVGRHKQSSTHYFDLSTGEVRSQPGGMLASFKDWTLRISGIGPDTSSMKLV